MQEKLSFQNLLQCLYFFNVMKSSKTGVLSYHKKLFINEIAFIIKMGKDNSNIKISFLYKK